MSTKTCASLRRATIAAMVSLYAGACDPAGGLLVRVRDAGAAPDAQDAAPDAQDAALDGSAPDAASDPSGPVMPGMALGEAVLDYYHVVSERADDAADVVLVSASCEELIAVANGFADAVCIQGVGQLQDGRVIQFDQLCDCGVLCPTGVRACFRFEDPQQAPWGRGSTGRALVPLRSLAVDQAHLDEVLYLPALDGVEIAEGPGIAAFTHDGCLRGDDSNGAAGSLAVRLFTGSQEQYSALAAVLPSGSTGTLHAGGARCEGLVP